MTARNLFYGCSAMVCFNETKDFTVVLKRLTDIYTE